MKITIATSFAPHQVKKQVYALESWRREGFDVISVNLHAEAAIVREEFPDLEIYEVSCETTEGNKYVPISEILKCLSQDLANVSWMYTKQLPSGLYLVYNF